MRENFPRIQPAVWAVFGVLALMLGAADLRAQSCPATDNDVARGRLEFFFTAYQYEPEREQFGIPTDGYTRARAVTNDAQDAWICNALRSAVRVPEYLEWPWSYTIYEADGRYYMVWVKLPLHETRIRIENGVLRGAMYRSPFSVFDAVGWRLFSDML